MKAKARSAIYLHGGERIKVPIPLGDLAALVAGMVRSKPGSLFEFERVTDHGTIKRVYLPVGLITHIEEL